MSSQNIDRIIRSSETHDVREAKSEECETIGKLLIDVYSTLTGFPSQSEQPRYYHSLKNIVEFTHKPGVKLLVAVNENNAIDGTVLYFDDMKQYGSKGIATHENMAAGFRLLAVASAARGHGVGGLLVAACVQLAREAEQRQIVIHSTKFMEVAWNMYEKLGFKRSPDLDFLQGKMMVFGFRLKLD